MRLPLVIVATATAVATACTEPGTDTGTTEVVTTGGTEPHSLGFGEPCIPLNSWSEEKETCKDGLMCAGTNKCGTGYCMKICNFGDACEPVDGVAHRCGVWSSDQDPFVCLVDCIIARGDMCPTSLAVSLECSSTPDTCVPTEDECADS